MSAIPANPLSKKSPEETQQYRRLLEGVGSGRPIGGRAQEILNSLAQKYQERDAILEDLAEPLGRLMNAHNVIRNAEFEVEKLLLGAYRGGDLGAMSRGAAMRKMREQAGLPEKRANLSAPPPKTLGEKLAHTICMLLSSEVLYETGVKLGSQYLGYRYD